MKWLNINVPLGVSETPIGFSRKSAGAGAALGAVGDMLYGIWNTYETNDSNERIAKNTNEANERINESQLAWAREQYELEKEENRFLVDQAYGRELENREYNSPSHEMQRLRAAGLNPYLAKYGNGAAGGVGSISAQVGQNPHANQPSAIPMQTGAPAIPNTHGLGLSQAVHDFYLAKDSERADFALASDITFRDYEARMRYLGYLLDKNKDARDDSFIKHQMLDADRRFKLAKDDFEKRSAWQNFQWELQNYQVAQRDTEIELQRLFNDSNISLNRAQANNLLQLVKESVQRVESMKHNDKLSDKEFYHLVGEDLFRRRIELSRLGIDVEKQPFEKFGLLFGAAAQTVGLGLGAYMGLRSGVSHSGIGNRNTVVRGFGY